MSDKRYCYSCGAVVKVTDVIYAYNEHTGEALTTERVNCPEKRWYNLGHPTTEEESYALQA